MKMTRAQLEAEIKYCIEEAGSDISGIAFRLMQFEAELIAEGNEEIELREMERLHRETENAFDEEIRVLKGGEGNVYRKAE